MMTASFRLSRNVILIALLAICARLKQTHSFTLMPSPSPSFTQCRAKKSGGGGGGFGAAKLAPKKPSKQAVAKKIQKTYGGTSQQDIARGTQQQMEKAMTSLPPHLQAATQLYQQLQKWNSLISSMSVLDQTKIPTQDMDGARRAKEELDRIYQEYDLTENDVHNIFQKITWDASADAKAARALTGKMPKEIEDRIDKACSIVADAVKAAGEDGTCLDVGCGFGVLTPSLTKAGVDQKQIYGVDLSPEMIRNAQEFYPGASFEEADFFAYEPNAKIDGFDAIILCSALHDLPDSVGALKKAASLLRPKGKLVIVHAQGASHVKKQVSANPVLVKRGLPDADELRELDIGLTLVVEPAGANSREESFQGYLAVLQKK